MIFKSGTKIMRTLPQLNSIRGLVYSSKVSISLPETNTHLKIGFPKNTKGKSSSNHTFSGAKTLVSGKVYKRKQKNMVTVKLLAPVCPPNPPLSRVFGGPLRHGRYSYEVKLLTYLCKIHLKQNLSQQIFISHKS